MPKKMKPFVPEFAEMPAVTVAVVHTVGDPTVIASKVFPALYGATYALKFSLKSRAWTTRSALHAGGGSGAPIG
jgi:hypothetical protein